MIVKCALKCVFSMTVIVLKGLLAVGMHHYGPSQLPINVKYVVQREPENRFDDNACAIVDCHTKRTYGYLKKGCAAKITKLIKLNIITSPVFIKAKYDAETKNRYVGPMQVCHIALSIDEKDKCIIEPVLKAVYIDFEYLN